MPADGPSHLLALRLRTRSETHRNARACGGGRRSDRPGDISGPRECFEARPAQGRKEAGFVERPRRRAIALRAARPNLTTESRGAPLCCHAVLTYQVHAGLVETRCRHRGHLRGLWAAQRGTARGQDGEVARAAEWQRPALRITRSRGSRGRARRNPIATHAGALPIVVVGACTRRVPSACLAHAHTHEDKAWMGQLECFLNSSCSYLHLHFMTSALIFLAGGCPCP